MAAHTQLTFKKEAPKNDYWHSKYGDRSSISLRFLDGKNPHGEEAVCSFVKCVKILAGKDIPHPLDWMNQPTSQRSMSDKRMIFSSPSDAFEFATVLQTVPFTQLYLDSFIFVDLPSSRLRMDNESIRIVVGEEGGTKTGRILTRNTNSATFERNDPFTSVLERLTDGSRTPSSSVTPIHHSPAKQARPESYLMTNFEFPLSSQQTTSVAVMNQTNGGTLNGGVSIPSSEKNTVSATDEDTVAVAEHTKETNSIVYPGWIETLTSIEDLRVMSTKTKIRVESYFGASTHGMSTAQMMNELGSLKRTLNESQLLIKFIDDLGETANAFTIKEIYNLFHLSN